MLRIRLRRVGAKKQPSYRVVVAERQAPRDGRFVEHIGYYNPRTEPVSFRIDEERALHWLSQGAQPSEAVERLLRKGETLDRFARLKAGESLEALLAEARQKSEVEAAEVGEAEVVAAVEQQEAEEEAEEEQPMAQEAPDASARGSDAGEPEIGEEPEE